MSGFEDRHSKAEAVELIIDPELKARREASNGIRQFQATVDLIKKNIGGADKFVLRQAHILELHEKALEGIHPLAGTYRNSSVEIGKSTHKPPRHYEVSDLVGEMCTYVNDNWSNKSAVHLAAYLLWRINWIHPFADGNGRTARVISYLVLSVKLNSLLPGSSTIPDQIASDKGPYYRALEEADNSWLREIVALSSMETMLEEMLTKQLTGAVEQAGAG